MENISHKFIKAIEANFTEHHYRLMEIFSVYHRRFLDRESFDNLRKTIAESKWLADPISRLTDAMLDYFEKGSFKREIDSNLLANNLGYIEYCKVVFAREYHFLKTNFGEAIPRYFEQLDKSRQLTMDLSMKTEELTDEEFLDAVKFEIIQLFGWLEGQFFWLYPNYHPVFSQFTDLNEPVPLMENDPYKDVPHLQLNYPGRNEADIINTVYKAVKNLINVSSDEFAKHFIPAQNLPKIEWKGALKNLILLFNGMHIKRGSEMKDMKLKITGKVWDILPHHFVDQNKEELKPESVKSSRFKKQKPKNPEEVSTIVNLLEALYDNFENN